MTEQPRELHWTGMILYVIAWLLCSLLFIINLLYIREASLDIMTAVQAQRIADAPAGTAGAERIKSGFQIEAIDQGYLLFAGIAAVVFAIGIEYYFRVGQKRGQLLRRMSWTLGILAVVFVLSFLVERLV